jgi:hypothetical protein
MPALGKLAAAPAVLFFLGEADLGEDAVGELNHHFVDGFGRVVEARHGGHEGGAGVVDAEHILEVDAIQGSFAEAEYEGASLFQANVGRAGEQIVGDAGGDGGECAGGARDDDHGVNGRAAGGDDRADVFVGQVLGFSCWRAGEERSELFCVGRDDVKFGSQQAEAGVGGDQVDALDTRVGVEQAQDSLRVDGAARAGDADGDLGSSSFRHGYSRINESRWAVSAKSRRRRRVPYDSLIYVDVAVLLRIRSSNIFSSC